LSKLEELIEKYAKGVSRVTGMDVEVLKRLPLTLKWADRMLAYLSNPVPILEASKARSERLIREYERRIEKHRKKIIRLEKLINLREEEVMGCRPRRSMKKFSIVPSG